jgi:hypothetical protein
MHHEDTEVAVLGLSTGAAVIPELARRGVQVTGLDRADGLASTLNNQRWKHSGLLYGRQDLAQKLWDAYAHMHPLERRYLLNVEGHFLVRTAEALDAHEALWCDWGIPFGRLAPNVLPPHEMTGPLAYAGGFLTFDSVIDFPALLPALHAHSGRLGARLLTGVTVTRLVRDGDAVTGEVLARSFRCVHKGAVRQSQDKASFWYELGFVPWTLQPPDAWHAAALAATLAGDLPGTPTCAILLGTSTERHECRGTSGRQAC